MFIGLKAAKANGASARTAEQRMAEGTHPDEIWKETLWSLAPDGLWRSEISDQSAQLLSYASILASCPTEPFLASSIKIERHANARVSLFIASAQGGPLLSLLRATAPAIERALGPALAALISRAAQETNSAATLDGAYAIPRINSLALEDVLHHPDLFENYPSLKSIQVAPFDGRSHPGCLMVYPESLSIHSLLHDVQHLVQDVEGFEKPIALREVNRITSYLQDQAASAVESLDELVKRRAFLHEEVASGMTEDERRSAGAQPLVQRMCAELASTGDGLATKADIAEIVSLLTASEGSSSSSASLLAESLGLLDLSIAQATLHANEIFSEYTDLCRLGPAKTSHLSFGETEARNTSARGSLSMAMRYAMPPSLTCDVDACSIKSTPKGFDGWADLEDQAKNSDRASNRLH